MARALIDDCFAHQPDRLTAAEALDLLKTRVRPVVDHETVRSPRRMAGFSPRQLVSVRDVPGFDNVAVDGFAFAHADLAPDRADPPQARARGAPPPAIPSRGVSRRARRSGC